MNEKISQFKAGLKMVFPLDLVIWQFPLPLALWQKGRTYHFGSRSPLFYQPDQRRSVCRPGDHYCRFFPCGNGYGTADHQPALLPDVLFSFPETGQSYAIFHRFLMSYGVTDEIFGVSVCKSGVLSPYFSYGLMAMAVPGWTIGTLLGAVSGSLLPARLLSALNVALYGMFLAVVIPPARENKVLRMVILVSMALSFLFTQIPVLRDISSGFKIIILTFIVAGSAAVLFPVKEEE